MVTRDMWDVSSPEFSEIFDRVSQEIDLRDRTTALQIERKLNMESIRSKVKAQKSKVRIVREYNAWNAEQLDKLVENDFAGRTIHEANLAPKGMIAQTLVYGQAEARKRVLAMKRSEVRANRGFKITRGDFF